MRTKLNITMIFTLCFLWLALAQGVCLGADYYIRSGATGNNDGSNWTNAWTDLSEARLPTGQLGLERGSTYYIADGTYGAYTFNDAESGSTYIYIKKAIESNHGTDTGWQSIYGDGQAVFNVTGRSTGLQFRHPGSFPAVYSGYYDFDGQVGGGPDDWDGSVTPHGFKVQNNYDYVDGANNLITVGNGNAALPSNIHFRHVEAVNISTDTAIRTVSLSMRQHVSNCASVAPAGTNTNYTVQYCYFKNAGHFFFPTLVENLTIEYSFFDTIIQPHPGQPNQGTWMNDNSSKNLIIRHNILLNCHGTAMLCLKKDCAEYIIDSGLPSIGREKTEGWEVYGNLMYWDENVPSYAALADRGWFGDTGDGPGAHYPLREEWSTNNMKIHNNTIANVTGGYCGIWFHGAYSTGNVAYNNLWYNCDSDSGTENNFWGHVDTHDYNWFDKIYGGGGSTGHYYDNILAAEEAHGQEGSSNPFTNMTIGDFTLVAATDAGKNDLGSPYNVDMFRNVRGADGVWDRGAIEYVAGSVEPPPVEPPAEEAESETEEQADDDVTVEKTDLSLYNNVLKAAGNSQATIRCDLLEAGNLSVKIYDSKGKEIVTLFDGNKDAGRHEFIWAGVDSGGSKVGSGIYLVYMESGGYKETKKIAVVK